MTASRGTPTGPKNVWLTPLTQASPKLFSAVRRGRWFQKEGGGRGAVRSKINPNACMLQQQLGKLRQIAIGEPAQLSENNEMQCLAPESARAHTEREDERVYLNTNTHAWSSRTQNQARRKQFSPGPEAPSWSSTKQAPVTNHVLDKNTLN
jgi:hypothetical protein